MPKNYEIKAWVPNISSAFKSAEEYISSYKNSSHFTEKQKDIYYKVPSGRLKLRIINGTKGNLIYYSRKEKRGRRVSYYSIYASDDPMNIDRLLRKVFRVSVTVSKKRDVFIAGNTRIHIDRVYSLGNYLEFEIIFNSFKAATNKMNRLINHFGLENQQLIKHSYSDLILKQNKIYGNQSRN